MDQENVDGSLPHRLRSFAFLLLGMVVRRAGSALPSPSSLLPRTPPRPAGGQHEGHRNSAVSHGRPSNRKRLPSPNQGFPSTSPSTGEALCNTGIPANISPSTRGTGSLFAFGAAILSARGIFSARLRATKRALVPFLRRYALFLQPKSGHPSPERAATFIPKTDEIRKDYRQAGRCLPHQAR